MLTEEEKKELRDLAQSPRLKKDMRVLSGNRHSPFVSHDNVDIDKLILFLTGYNQFVNHMLRPFHKIIDRDMRL